MLRFYHSPNTRSTRVAALIDEMGVADRIDWTVVHIPRIDGSGRADPANLHPERKVPALDHDGRIVTESGAVMLYLTHLFPHAGMSPEPGSPDWGVFLTWMTWYQGVMEPVMICDAAGISHPWLTAALRGKAEVMERIRRALDRGPWILGDAFSAADLLISSPFMFFPDSLPDEPVLQDWFHRCQTRPARAGTMAREAALTRQLAEAA